MSFWKKHKVLTSAKFGFRPNMSCVQAIVKVKEYIRKQIDKKWLDKRASLTSKKFRYLKSQNFIAQVGKLLFQRKN